MKYTIASKSMLIEVDRTKILDISVGDVISLSGIVNIEYAWTEQDDQFAENNPAAAIYIRVEDDGNKPVGKGVLVIPQEYQH